MVGVMVMELAGREWSEAVRPGLGIVRSSPADSLRLSLDRCRHPGWMSVGMWGWELHPGLGRPVISRGVGDCGPIEDRTGQGGSRSLTLPVLLGGGGWRAKADAGDCRFMVISRYRLIACKRIMRKNGRFMPIIAGCPILIRRAVRKP
jgi:hypothetical protein